MRRIKAVSCTIRVYYDDGTHTEKSGTSRYDFTKAVDEGTILHLIKEYVEGLILDDAICAYASSHPGFDREGYLKALNQSRATKAQRLEAKGVTNRENATKPRIKDVGRDKLVAFKDDYERKHGGPRGWKKAARLQFNIDGKTLNNKMAE